jgi:hypothetical protein
MTRPGPSRRSVALDASRKSNTRPCEAGKSTPGIEQHQARGKVRIARGGNTRRAQRTVAGRSFCWRPEEDGRDANRGSGNSRLPLR